MNRKARRRARRGRGGALLATGPRWAAFGRGLRRQVRAGRRAARGQTAAILITLAYTLAAALCLGGAALLLASAAVPPAAPLTAAAAHAAAGPTLRAGLIGGLVLGALGVVLLGAAVAQWRGWRR